jgi:hypothetical protein
MDRLVASGRSLRLIAGLPGAFSFFVEEARGVCAVSLGPVTGRSWFLGGRARDLADPDFAF